MDLKEQWKLFQLGLKLIRDKRDEISLPLNHYKREKSLEEREELRYPMAIPEAEGVRSRDLVHFLRLLEGDRKAALHAIRLVKGGKTLLHANFSPYRGELPHVLHSVSKTITSLVVGVITDRGLFSVKDKVTDFFKGKIGPINQLQLRDLTVEHLLTMTSGLSSNESLGVTEEHWMKDILNSGLQHAPGKRFVYNSMNTYVLSAILTSVTGKSLRSLAEEELFAPMGIEDYEWGSTREGVTYGGFGLYLRIEDLMRFGELIMQGGVFDGKRLVSEEYIREMTRPHTDTDKGYGYGYQLWIDEENGFLQMNGMLGQNLIMDSVTGAMIASYAASQGLFFESSLIDHAKELLLHIRETEKEELPAAEDSVRLLRQKEEGLVFLKKASEDISLRGGWALRPAPGGRSLGRERRMLPLSRPNKERSKMSIFRENFDGVHAEFSGNSVSLYPLFMQFMDGQLSTGVEEMSFGIRDGRILLTWKESSETLSFLLQPDCETRIELSLMGKTYKISLNIRVLKEERLTQTLLFRIIFLESANVRLIRMVKRDNKIILKADELPSLYELYQTMIGQKTPGILQVLTDAPPVLNQVKDEFMPTAEGRIL